MHPPHLRHVARAALAYTLYIVSVLVPCSAAAQLRAGVMLAPAIQNLSAQEAQIQDGYKAKLLPQAGFLATCELGKGLSVRLGLRYDAQGMRFRSWPHLDHAYDAYWEHFRIDFLKVALGAGYGGAVAERLTLAGAVDVVYGLPVGGAYHVVEDGKAAGRTSLDIADFGEYWGMDLGLSLQYDLKNGIGLAMAPTFQTQINHVFVGNRIRYRFVGFAPRIAVSFPIFSRRSGQQTN